MSEGSNVPWLNTNNSFLHSERRQRTLQRLSLTLESARRLRDSFCKKLEDEYSSESDIELPGHIVTEREFPFASADESLLKINTTDPTADFVTDKQNPEPNKRLISYISRTLSRVSSQGEFSLTSYDSDLFDPNEISEY